MKKQLLIPILYFVLPIFGAETKLTPPELRPQEQLTKVEVLIQEQQAVISFLESQQKELTTQKTDLEKRASTLQQQAQKASEEQQIELTVQLSSIEPEINTIDIQLFSLLDLIDENRKQLDTLQTQKQTLQKEFSSILGIIDDALNHAAHEPLPTPEQLFLIGPDKIIMQPSLQQAIKDKMYDPETKKMEDTTNSTSLCGYYALWNAQCFSENKDSAYRLSRPQFCQELETILLDIKQQRIKNRRPELQSPDKYTQFGWLTSKELEEYIQQQKISNTIVVELLGILQAAAAIQQFKDIDQQNIMNLTLGERQTNLLTNFIEKKQDKLVIILVTGLAAGHYVTLNAKRIDDAITLSVADSMASTIIPEIVENRMTPVLMALRGNWDAFSWDQVKNMFGSQATENLKEQMNVWENILKAEEPGITK